MLYEFAQRPQRSLIAQPSVDTIEKTLGFPKQNLLSTSLIIMYFSRAVIQPICLPPFDIDLSFFLLWIDLAGCKIMVSPRGLARLSYYDAPYHYVFQSRRHPTDLPTAVRRRHGPWQRPSFSWCPMLHGHQGTIHKLPKHLQGTPSKNELSCPKNVSNE